jgi:hypothetical protein
MFLINLEVVFMPSTKVQKMAPIDGNTTYLAMWVRRLETPPAKKDDRVERPLFL